MIKEKVIREVGDMNARSYPYSIDIELHFHEEEETPHLFNYATATFLDKNKERYTMSFMGVGNTINISVKTGEYPDSTEDTTDSGEPYRIFSTLNKIFMSVDKELRKEFKDVYGKFIYDITDHDDKKRQRVILALAKNSSYIKSNFDIKEDTGYYYLYPKNGHKQLSENN